jgi:hypothetical protein
MLIPDYQFRTLPPLPRNRECVLSLRHREVDAVVERLINQRLWNLAMEELFER